MSRRHGVAALRIVAAAGLFLVGAGHSSAEVGPANRSQAPTPWTTVSVTPWVAADGTWTAVLDLGAAPTDGATISYSIHRPVTGNAAERRRRIEGIAGGDDPGPELQGTVTRPASELTAGTKVTITIPIRSRSGSADRVLVPNPGVHPVVIDYRQPGTSTSNSTVLFLNRVAEPGKRPPLRVGLIESLGGAPAFTPSGDPAMDPTSLAALGARLDAIDGSPVPVALAVDPSILDSLALSPTTDSESTALAEAVQAHPVIRRPWVPLNVESWATTGELVDIQTQLVRGQSSLDDARARRMITRLWPPDDTLGPQSVPVLSRVGVDRLVLSPGQVATKVAASDTLGLRSVRVGSTGTTEAITLISEAQSLLDDRASDPVRSANALVAVVQSGWAADTSTDQLGTILSLDQASPQMVSAVLGAFGVTGNPTMGVTAVDEVFNGLAPLTTTGRQKSETVTVGLTSPRTVDERGVSQQLATTRTRLYAHRSSIREPATQLDLERRSLFAQHRSFTLNEQLQVLREIDSKVARDFARIAAAPPRTVTVTSRAARLSIRVTNGLSQPARVLMKVQSPRIKVRGGPSQTIDLAPGTNRVDLPVTVRTSGQFTVGIQFRSADDQVVITSTRLRVRSSVFSGVGVVLSIGAGLFLVVWWGRTLRRERRQRSAGGN